VKEGKTNIYLILITITSVLIKSTDSSYTAAIQPALSQPVLWVSLLTSCELTTVLAIGEHLFQTLLWVYLLDIPYIAIQLDI